MAKVLIDHELCKKCKICVEFCPMDVYSFNELEGPKVEQEEKCIGCDKCVIMCPDFAVEVIEGEEVK
ncbi:4Fe-4S dicluster domain-containing protein [Acetohalobium arabaticum]|uniref:4Fe-4S ferredoxin iron-sulfur binding domain protein n=1 Tax=Acetohalobium arabaticum (strain ATCC 49924 / DSM 5501 / Z-7288) TaxID=574087 RepID=D9QUU0_ACEAZ|nr:4Fe-4S binding protein [Acetohalobium arabaticum]ADL11999.1 4Fe-4S ferredoxin iron-sulfur binding domain protein [Acetohalobium arabaticum DSM 5501]